MSVMPHQIQEHNGQKGMWMYQCIRCKKNFASSQAIAGHTRGHFRDGWVKGTPQSRVFVKLSDSQQQHGPATASSISKQQVVSSETDSTNAHRLPKGGVQNFGSLAARPSSQASSSRRPRAPRHHFSVCDLKILARVRARLTGEERKATSRVLASALHQVKQSRKKSTEVEAIPNKDSEATPEVEVITIEDSDDESKTM